MTGVDALRNAIRTRAKERCEYCLLHQDDAGFPHEVDHIISRKHRGTNDLDNLAFAGYLCNRYKGSDIASIHRPTAKLVQLFHPRRDAWTEHFRIAGPVIEPKSEIAFVTIELLRFNVAPRVIERKLLQSLSRYPKA